MVFGWEREEEKLLRFMGMSPEKKLEWLNQMREFFRKALTKKQRAIYQKMRESR